MTNRPLTEVELQELAAHQFDAPDNLDEDYIPSSDDEFSEEEIEHNDDDSSSEQNFTSDESDEVPMLSKEYFIGKDKMGENKIQFVIKN